MIELDNGPLAISFIIALAFAGPIFYALFIDRKDKK
jgi:hypothetical protein